MKKNFIITMLIFFASVEVWAASVSSSVRQGNGAYEKGDYNKALEYYEKALAKDPESEVVNYNLGTAHYKIGAYEKAVLHLQKSLLSDNQALKKKAHYNLGNTFYRYGVGKEKHDLDEAISSLEKSLGQYERASRIGEQDADVAHNHDFVQMELERLKKLLQQQQQNQQQEKDQQKPDDQQPLEEEEETDSGQQQEPNKEEGASQQQGGQEDEKKDDSPEDLGQNDEQEQEQDKEPSSSSPRKGSPQGAKELSEEEVEMMLNDYRQNEEPQGLLNFMKRKAKDSPVEKDW